MERDGRCVACGGVVKEDESSGVLVCVSCGLLHSSESNLDEGGARFGQEGQFVSAAQTAAYLEGLGNARGNLERPSQSKIVSLAAEIASSLPLPRDIPFEAQRLARQVVSRSMRLRAQEVAAACVYSAARAHGHAVTARDIATSAGITTRALLRCHKRLAKVLDVKIRPVSVQQLVTRYTTLLAEKWTDDRGAVEEDVPQLSALLSLATSLCALAKERSIVEGRNQNYLAVALSSLCLRAMLKKDDVPLSRAVELLELSAAGANHSTRSRYTELTDEIAKLCQKGEPPQA